MKVSVCMITYNQEIYIAQAIESVMMQEADFDYELVIGEDCSIDKTREICMAYQAKYPDKIRLMLHEKNLGMMQNFVRTHHACTGQYIALLDGDDYWTSPNKLAKQVDFLDHHSECAICFHNARVINEDGSRPPSNFCPPDQKKISNLQDLLLSNFVPTCSAMFRRSLFGKFPEWFSTLGLGDWPLHILNAQYGQVAYINETLGVYRFHSGGWSAQSEIRNHKHTVRMFVVLESYLDPRYTRAVKEMAALYYFHLAELYERCGKLTEAKDYLKTSFITSPLNRNLVWHMWIRMLVRTYVPKLHRMIKDMAMFSRRHGGQ